MDFVFPFISTFIVIFRHGCPYARPKWHQSASGIVGLAITGGCQGFRLIRLSGCRRTACEGGLGRRNVWISVGRIIIRRVVNGLGGYCASSLYFVFGIGWYLKYPCQLAPTLSSDTAPPPHSLSSYYPSSPLCPLCPLSPNSPSCHPY